jgi:hypothetical protein
MTSWMLRVEGVNLDHFVYDTKDLSTTRGGSLLLLHAIEQVPGFATSVPATLTPISTGASSGLFSFEGDGAKVRDEVAQGLRSHIKLKHATFVVDVVEKSASFQADVARLIAANRWRQMTSPSLAIPSTGTSSPEACAIDLVRPCVEATTLPGVRDQQRISASVLVRRKYGKDEKHLFYDRELEELARTADEKSRTGIESVRRIVADREFAFELDELTNDPSRGNLNHKMAVIYVDGNSFGLIQAGLDGSALKRWDTTLKRYRRQLLFDLLSRFPFGGWDTNFHRWRFETLLWGGDELMWVVPAWKGWETLQFFFREASAWKFNAKNLKHAAGLVFCHHNAPIQRIIHLAKDLADLAKDHDRERNLFAYQVLESFDHVTGDLNRFREGRIPREGAAVTELILDPAPFDSTAAVTLALRHGLPKNKLHDIVLALRRDPERAKALIDKTLGDAFGDPKDFEPLRRLFGGTDTAWFHLADLWDYLPDEDSAEEVQA